MKGVLVLATSVAALRENEEVAVQREADYSEHGENWGGECGGEMQSPINIASKDDGEIPVEVFGYRYHDIKDLSLEIIDSGLVGLFGGEKIGGVQYNNHYHPLEKVMVHAPSEHTIDGKRYPLEVQLFHQNEDPNRHSVIVSVLLESPGNQAVAPEIPTEEVTAESLIQESVSTRVAATSTTNLLQKLILRPDLYDLEKKVNAAEAIADNVLKSKSHHHLQLTTAMLHTHEDGFTAPGQDDEGFNPALHCFSTIAPPGIEDAPTVTLENVVNFNDLLEDQANYYQYSGSLTTQPCAETVSWLVSSSPVMASDAQIEVLTSHADLLTNKIGNYRAAKPLGHRIVNFLQSQLLPEGVDPQKSVEDQIQAAQELTEETMATAREMDRRLRAAALAGNETLVAALRGDPAPIAEPIAPPGVDSGPAGEEWIQGKLSQHMAETVREELKKQLKERVAPAIKAAAQRVAENPLPVAQGGLPDDEAWPWPTTAARERKFKNIPCETAGGCPDGEEMQEIVEGVNDDATLEAQRELEAAEAAALAGDDVNTVAAQSEPAGEVITEVTGAITDGNIVSPMEVTVEDHQPAPSAAFLARAGRVGTTADNL